MYFRVDLIDDATSQLLSEVEAACVYSVESSDYTFCDLETMLLLLDSEMLQRVPEASYTIDQCDGLRYLLEAVMLNEDIQIQSTVDRNNNWLSSKVVTTLKTGKPIELASLTSTTIGRTESVEYVTAMSSEPNRDINYEDLPLSMRQLLKMQARTETFIFEAEDHLLGPLIDLREAAALNAIFGAAWSTLNRKTTR